METNTPKLIEGGVFSDQRGTLEFVNDFDLSAIKRMYFTINKSVNIVRAWQGHKIEKRWFFCVRGSFIVKLIKIDDWGNPSLDCSFFEFELTSKKPQVLYIPNGYVNGFKALEENSKLMIMSDYALNEIQNDAVRFDYNKRTKWKI